MSWFDWLIVLVPFAGVLGMGLYTRRYLKDITTFLSAGRVCGRYVLSVGDIANALSIISLLAYVEIHYKTGFALSFWQTITLPLSVILSLFGYCTYRFRETKAQSIGQFLELRYSRKLRIFAAILRSFTEMCANMIMPSLAARFFIYFLDLPKTFQVFGVEFPTFNALMLLLLSIAIFIICIGGSLSIIVTDTIQGFICYPLMVIFVVYVLYKFSWTEEIMPVMANRVKGENFLNPFDIYELREFNLFLLLTGVVGTFLHRSSWAGNGGASTAAKSPHEQKMSGLLGTWRTAMGQVLYVLIAVAILTFLTHYHFSSQAHEIRTNLTRKISNELITNDSLRKEINENISKVTAPQYNPATDQPLSEKQNVDTIYLDTIYKTVSAEGNKGQKNSLFQQFRTLYYQQMLPMALRQMLPPGMLGLFCLLMLMAMVSTDDTRIFSSTVTISQDIFLPMIKKELTPKQHMWMLRLTAIGVGIFFFLGSSFMSQLDYITMYMTLVCTLWIGGCGPVIVFGLYSRYGTTKGAWTSLVTGMSMAIIGLVVQRNWANMVYPWLSSNGWDKNVAKILETLSGPFEPIVVWRMNAVKCPISSYEWYFITMMTTLILYWVVSFLSCKEPFNLDRMLHRGIYAIDGKRTIVSVWSWRNIYNKLIGITPEYTTGDKVIAWGYFIYSVIYRFLGTFIIVLIWNLIDPWPFAWWGWYFLITFLIIPGTMAIVTAIWFGICGTIDLRRMFRDLAARIASPLDNGRVEGNLSLADKAAMEKIEAEKKQ